MPAKRSAAYPARLLLPGILIVAMVLTAAATWYAATGFQSPQQLEARALPPAAEPITVSARTGVLTDSFTSRVQFAPGDVSNVPLTHLIGRVVTATPAAQGQALQAGALVLEANGRPVFALVSPFPLYRDLSAGDSGADVTMWQNFLRTLGFSIPTAENGRFGARTVNATHTFYSNRGYKAPDQLTSAPASSPAQGAPTPQADQAPETQEAATAVVLASEFVRIPGPDLILTSSPHLGDTLSEEHTLTFSDGSSIATTAIPVMRAPDLTGSEHVRITTDTGEIIEGHLDGPITTQAHDGDDSDEGESSPTEIAPTTVAYRVTLPESSADYTGKDFLIEIIVSSLDSTTLIVPARALVHNAGGDFIHVKNADGEFTEVPVNVIDIAAGEAAITPTTEGAVNDGDQVLVK